MASDQHLLDLDLSSIEFVRVLKSCDPSTIFEINLDGQKYVLKVYHDNGDPGFAKNGRDLNRFRCELNAYRNLSAAGVCERGFAPLFHGYIDRINPAINLSLVEFTHDEFHPSAILLEYLPNAEDLDCVNFSEALDPQAIEGMKEIHKAHVFHHDVYPKNILLVHGDPDRLVWIDFDVAMTFTDETPDNLKTCDWEDERVLHFCELLKQDQADGLPPNTKFY